MSLIEEEKKALAPGGFKLGTYRLLEHISNHLATTTAPVSGDFDPGDDSDFGSGLREHISGVPGAKVERNAHGQYLVRGRLFDPTSKPKTFNQV